MRCTSLTLLSVLLWGGCWRDSGLCARNEHCPNDQYCHLASHQCASRWKPLPDSGLLGRYNHTAVWTGSEMIIWGGYNDRTKELLADGARYDPLHDTWRAVTSKGAPAARDSHTAVWTGSRMIVWGGICGGASPYSDGFAYDPAKDEWTKIAEAPSPWNGGHNLHTAVWDDTDRTMLLWGGLDSTCSRSNQPGVRYYPDMNIWTKLNSMDQPTPRTDHEAVWAHDCGSGPGCMIVWGGLGPHGDGWQYFPQRDEWAGPINMTGAPGARYESAAVWDDKEKAMILWGGYRDSPGVLDDGALFYPFRNMWQRMTGTGAPQARRAHTAVFTGSKMIVWGGIGAPGILGDGGIYQPLIGGGEGTWVPALMELPRRNHTAVWTGSEMIVWGGLTNDEPWGSATGARFVPPL